MSSELMVSTFMRAAIVKFVRAELVGLLFVKYESASIYWANITKFSNGVTVSLSVTDIIMTFKPNIAIFSHYFAINTLTAANIYSPEFIITLLLQVCRYLHSDVFLGQFT